MLYKFMYGFYPVMSCTLKLVEMQSKMYLTLSTLTGAILVSEELNLEPKEPFVTHFMAKLTKFINSNCEKYDEIIIDLDLFLKEYK